MISEISHPQDYVHISTLSPSKLEIKTLSIINLQELYAAKFSTYMSYKVSEMLDTLEIKVLCGYGMYK